MTQQTRLHNGDVTPLYVGGKPVYRFYPSTRTLFKRIRQNHILRRPPGIAFDVAILDEAAALGCEWVSCRNVDTGARYHTSFEWVREFGVEFNRGYGQQVALPLSYWEVDGQRPSRKPVKVARREAEALQPSLFGGA